MDHMKLKSFCIAMEMVTRLKMQSIEWKKIFASYICNMGFLIRVYRESNLNSQRINDPMKKWANELSRAFSKEEVQMAKNHMKKYSIFLAIKEMKIKTTLKFHLTLVRMAIVKNTYTHTHTHTHTHTEVLARMWEQRTLYTLLEM
jgi:hypothetical protein